MSGCCSGDKTGGGSPPRPARQGTRIELQTPARRQTGIGSGPSAPVPSNAKVIRQPTIEAGSSKAGAGGSTTAGTAGGSSRAPVITTTPMTSAEAIAATVAITKALAGIDYAFIGGLALRILGQPRDTADADIFVEDKNVGVVARALEAFGSFGTEPSGKGYRVWFTASTGKNYNVDLMTPAKINLRWPTDPEAIITVPSGTYKGAKYLKLAMLLDSKALSWEGRGDDKRDKKLQDQKDMVTLAKIMKDRNETCPRGAGSRTASGVVGIWRQNDPVKERDNLFAAIGL